MQHRPSGWNTWDFRGFNRFSRLDRGALKISLHYAIWDDQVPPPAPDSRKLGELYEVLRWDNATRLGPHAALGLPAELDFQVTGTPFRASAWVDDESVFHLSIKPLEATHKRVLFIFDAPDGEMLQRNGAQRGVFAGHSVALEHATWPGDYFVNVDQPYAVAPAGWGATVSITPRRLVNGLPAQTFERYRDETLDGAGALADAPRAMTQAVLWNTLYDHRRKMVSSPVSRDWCYDWRGVLVFCWDTFLVGTFVSYESPQLSRYNFEAVCEAIREMGHVPNYYMAHGAASRDRSMPPLGSYMVLKTQRASLNKSWLRRIYRLLTTWHEYWMKNRDGNGDGLLSWGSNAEPPYQFPQLTPYNGVLQHNKQSAMYESGLDNSPLFDEAEFNPQTNTLELNDVMLNSIYAMDCEALAEMAEILGQPVAAKRYRAEYEEMKQRINDQLWDEEHGLYCDRHWDGRFSGRWAPTSFFTMIAGVATPERAERMVKEHLLNEREFWGKYVIPAISRSDPAYPDNDYWRGRIWGPFNFLVGEGLRRYRMDDVAADLAQRSLDLFMENWRKDGGVYENYNADTGQGADVWNAARLYHWGGLLAFLGMQELIDVEPMGWLRFGSQRLGDAELRNVHIGDDTYEVRLGAGVEVLRNGRPFLSCSTRAIVRLPLKDASLPIEISVEKAGELALFAADAPPTSACINGKTTVKVNVTKDAARYAW